MGRGADPEKSGVRVEKSEGGERGLEGLKEVCGTMLEEGRALIGNKDKGWEIAENLVREGDVWANGEIKIRCGKK